MPPPAKATEKTAGNNTSVTCKITDGQLYLEWNPDGESGGRYSLYRNEGVVLKPLDERGTRYADTTIAGLNSQTGVG